MVFIVVLEVLRRKFNGLNSGDEFFEFGFLIKGLERKWGLFF